MPRSCSRRRESRSSTSRNICRTVSPRCRRRAPARRTRRRRRMRTPARGSAAARRSVTRWRPTPPTSRAGAQRRARSADRPDRGTEPDDGDPVPAAEEQSGVRGGRGGGQDGDRRRARDASTPRRRAGSARGRRSVLARHRSPARRHPLPGRLRGALQGGDQRAGQAQDANPVHRRDPLDGRRRGDHRRHDGSGHADQADPHHRRVARHRIDDPRRVQAHREGPRAGAAAAADRDRRAERAGDRAHPARAAVALRVAPPRPLH